MIQNTFIFNPVRPDFIHRCLDTLYQYTDMTNNRVIVVDQTLDGLRISREQVHLVLRPYRNLGFAKSMNEGILHALRWGSEYITCANDDIEYINARWWDGILETFKKYERVLAVNPESPRIPLWGYGRPHGEYLDLVPYKEKYTSEDYNYLLKGDFSELDALPIGLVPDTFPRQKSGVTDAVATWHTTFKSEFFEKIGLFEERYYPGGGEDYDLNARCYREDGRMLGTTLSWVWHHWGSSKDHQTSKQIKGEGLPIIDELRWMNPGDLWPEDMNGGQSMDPWGKWTDTKGNKHPMYRDPEIGIIEI